MMEYSKLPVIFSVLYLITSTANGESLQTKIRNDIFAHYYKAYGCEWAPKNVSLFISLHKLLVNEQIDKVSFTFMIAMEWTDDQLQWDDTHYNGKNVISVNSKLLWTPDLRPVIKFRTIKEARNVAKTNPKITKYAHKAIVTNLGEVFYYYSFTVTTHCQINTENWPVDVQDCEIKFITIPNGNCPLLITTLNLITESLARKGNEWALLSWAIKKYSFARNDKTNSTLITYEIIDLKFKIQRQGFNHTTTYGVTLIIIVTVTLLMFWLEPKNPNRIIILGVFIIIEQSLLTVLSDQIPKTGTTVPIVCKYLGLITVITTLCILETIFLRILITYKIQCELLQRISDQISKMSVYRFMNISNGTGKNITLEETNEEDHDEEIEQQSLPSTNEGQIKKKDVTSIVVSFVDNIMFMIVFCLYTYSSVSVAPYT